MSSKRKTGLALVCSIASKDWGVTDADWQRARQEFRALMALAKADHACEFPPGTDFLSRSNGAVQRVKRHAKALMAVIKLGILKERP